MMAQELLQLSDDTYIFIESEDKRVFYFYRKDGEKLGDVGRMPMDFYQAYIMQKMMKGDISGPVFGNLCFETSNDEKCIRITIVDYEELPKVEKDPADNQKKLGIMEKLFCKIWKRKRKE